METRVWRHFDVALVLAALCLVAYGLVMIYSATYLTGESGFSGLVFRQGMYAVVGLTMLIVLAVIDYRLLANLAWVFYAFGIAMLGLVLVAGRILHGSQRWIQSGPVQFQPAELTKLIVIIVLAKYLSERPDNVGTLRFVVTSILIPAIPAALVIAEPDIGTSSVYLAIWLGMIFVAGVRLLYFGLLFGSALACAPLAWLVMQQYMKQRILTFLNPQSDPLGAGYSAIQALISVGSGGLTGRGFLSGSQSQLHFVSVQYADFIFSVLAEELGFVGAAGLLFLFCVVFLRGMRVASLSRETFGRLVAAGVVSMFAYQVIVNVGMNVGLLPVTGVPLPMISYGGSSLMTFMASIGILESIVMRHRKFEF